MLFTNNVLETIYDEERGEKILLMDCHRAFGSGITIEESLRENLIQVEDRFHKNLSFERQADDKYIVTDKSKNNNILTVVLDTFSYRHYNNDGYVYSAEGINGDFEILLAIMRENEAKTCKWLITAFNTDVSKNKFMIFKILNTSGYIKYLTINKGFVKLVNEEGANRLLAQLNKPSVSEIDWI